MSAITIVNVSNAKLELDEQQLKKILLHPRARNKVVVVISITGVLRQGKSTMLNFIKRFLENKGKSGWIEANDQPVRGFKATQGNKPVTEGIVMWSEPFIWNLNGEDVAVFLVDCQGSFEVGLNNEANSALFVLSSLLSSIQIFNVMDMINQRDFEHLTLFGRYANAISRASEKIEAFQKLVILIRDWRSPGNIKYGTTQLSSYLNNSGKTHESEEWKEIKNEFERVFNDISCCLLPYPGEKIAIFEGGEPKSEFYINDFSEGFINHVKIFVEGLFKSYVVKKVGGVKITSERLFELFKEYYNVLQSGKISPPESILKAAAKNGYYEALQVAIKYYKTQLNDYANTKGFWVTTKGVGEKAVEAKLEAEQLLEIHPSITHDELSNEYQEKLSREMDETECESLLHASRVQKNREVAVTLAGLAIGGAVGGVGGATAGMSVAETAMAVLSTGLGTGAGVIAGANVLTKALTEISKKKET